MMVLLEFPREGHWDRLFERVNVVVYDSRGTAGDAVRLYWVKDVKRDAYETAALVESEKRVEKDEAYAQG
jgi:hypothetical protein